MRSGGIAERTAPAIEGLDGHDRQKLPDAGDDLLDVERTLHLPVKLLRLMALRIEPSNIEALRPVAPHDDPVACETRVPDVAAAIHVQIKMGTEAAECPSLISAVYADSFD